MSIVSFVLSRRNCVSDIFLNIGHISFGGLVIGQLVSEEGFQWLGISAGIAVAVIIYFAALLFRKVEI